MQSLDFAVLILYFLVMAAMGPICARKGRTTEGYFVGNRQYSGWLLGISMFATSISSITVLAYPADAFKTAYLRFLPCLMLPVGILIASYVFLPYFRRARITSAFEYLEGRFGPRIRLYAACAFLVGQLFRQSLVLYLVSLMVYQMLGLNPYLCIMVGGIVTAFYTVIGGIEAIVWTVLVQSILLWGGGLLCLLVIIYSLDGGFAEMLSVAWADGKFMLGDLNTETMELEPSRWGFSLTDRTVVMLLLFGLFNWLTEYSSNQNVIQKYVAAKNPKEATKAIWVCCGLSVPAWFFFMLLGTGLYVYFQAYPTPEATNMLTGAEGAKADEILPYFIIQNLPVGLSGLVIAGVLAAAMSSISSSINCVSAISIVDIYKRHLATGRPDQHYVLAAKAVSVASSVFMLFGAVLLMSTDDKTLQDTSVKIGSLLAAGLLGLYMLGFLTRRGDGRAVAVGIVSTLLFTLYMFGVEFGWFTGPIDVYYTSIIGNVVMFAVSYVAASVFFKTDRDLTNLTVWTTPRVPVEEVEPVTK